MFLANVNGNSIKNAFRYIKVYLFGGVRDRRQVAAFGIDSAPINGVTAIYAKTATTGEDVIVGYINTSCLAATGEIRIFSQDANGTPQAYAHCKSDGTLHLNGNADFAVRYSTLETAFNSLKSDFNSLVTTFNAHTHLYSPGPSTPTPTPPPATPATPSSADITGAKITTIKTP